VPARLRLPGGVLEVELADEVVVRAEWVHARAQGSVPAWLRTAINDYCDGRLDALSSVPYRLAGTRMRLDTWEAMRRIAPGTVSTYGMVAQRAGYPRAARAVGTACAVNPIALFVPCHRVVAAHGLGGYAFGESIKRALLEHEGLDPDALQPI